MFRFENRAERERYEAETQAFSQALRDRLHAKKSYILSGEGDDQEIVENSETEEGDEG